MKQLEELKKKQMTYEQGFLRAPFDTSTNVSETLSNQGKLLDALSKHLASVEAKVENILMKLGKYYEDGCRWP